MNNLHVSQNKEIGNPCSITFEERKNQLQAQDDAEKEQQKQEKKSSFSRWTQFNNQRTKELMWLAIKHPKAHAILYFLVDQMDEYNAVMCSYKVLQEVLEISRQTASKNIQILKKNGYIAVLKSGTSNVYAINDTVYWKSWSNNRKYSKFPANVVLSLSEQDENYQYNFLEFIKHKEITKK